MNILKLPKHDEVTEIDLGNMRASIVKLTEENRLGVLEVALSMYMDDVCMYCKRNFTHAELQQAVWAHENPHGRIVHKSCWDANTPKGN